MLLELHVRGLGLIGDAHVSFAPGLNALTGETGAGKTLLVTSLALLTGARADGRLAPGGDASVEAVVRPPPPVRSLLDERGLDVTEDLVLARRIGPGGRSRAWMGGLLVPAGTLADVGRGLIEIHGQADGFALARPQAQLDALDAFGDMAGPRRDYEAALARVRGLTAERESILSEERERARTIDVLAFQVDEIERARLDPEADEELASAVARHEHAERLQELGTQAVERTASEGAAGLLGEAAKLLRDAAALDHSAGTIAERARVLAEDTGDLAAGVRAWTASLEHDPAHLETLRERHALVLQLRRKYGESVRDVLDFGSHARARVDELRGAEARAHELDEGIACARAELDAHAAALSSGRRTAARRLERIVRDELPALALPQAKFEASVEDARADGEHGRDRVELRFSSHASAAPGPLGRIASGGELSRVMIALTLALARAHGVPVLVFDEADQGVGGQAALELGRRLSRLARTHQVLVVTHLPQIAAFADRHVLVERRGADVRVRAVDGDERVTEISRMLAGLGESARARAHAAELIGLAGAERAGARVRRKGRVVAEAS